MNKVIKRLRQQWHVPWAFFGESFNSILFYGLCCIEWLTMTKPKYSAILHGLAFFSKCNLGRHLWKWILVLYTIYMHILAGVRSNTVLANSKWQYWKLCKPSILPSLYPASVNWFFWTWSKLRSNYEFFSALHKN